MTNRSTYDDAGLQKMLNEHARQKKTAKLYASSRPLPSIVAA